MVVRLLATTALPDPPGATAFVMATTPEAPEMEPPPAPRAQSSTPSVSRNATPVEEPDSLAPEPRELADTIPAGAGTLLGTARDVTGDPFGDGPPEAPVPRVAAPPAPQPPVRIGGGIRPPQKIHHVAPEYPAIARSARVSGVVILEAFIAEDGSVRDVKVLRSVPLLDTPAVDAVRQWRFTPTLLNGVPVQVIMTVTVSFTLT